MRVGSSSVDLDDAELVGQRDGLADGRDGGARARGDVRLDHLREVHAVDVVGADHDDDVGLLVAEQVEALQDGVGRAGEPALAEPLLRGHRGDVGVEQSRRAARSATTWRSRLCDLYWVSTTIWRRPELIRFDSAKSMRR